MLSGRPTGKKYSKKHKTLVGAAKHNNKMVEVNLNKNVITIGFLVEVDGLL